MMAIPVDGYRAARYGDSFMSRYTNTPARRVNRALFPAAAHAHLHAVRNAGISVVGPAGHTAMTAWRTSTEIPMERSK